MSEESAAVVTEVENPNVAETGNVFKAMRGLAPTPVAAAPAVETPAPEVPQTPEAAPVETPVAESVETPAVEDKTLLALKEKFGTDNIDELYSKYEGLAKAEQRALELESEASELRSFRDTVQNPYSNEKLKEVDAFLRKTGITDTDTAVRFSGKKAEEIGQKPLDALALAYMIDNGSVGADFTTVREAMKEQFGLDEDIKLEDLTAAQKLSVQKAAHTIGTALSKEDQTPNVFDKWKSETTQRTAQAKEAIASWEGKVKIDLKNIPIDIAGDDGLPNAKFDIQVSEQTRKKIQDEIQNAIASNAVPYNKETHDVLINYARNRAIELESMNVFKTVHQNGYNEALGKAREEALKETHNPAEVVRTEKTAAPVVNGAEQVGNVFRGMKQQMT
jgi:hypothetical protein